MQYINGCQHSMNCKKKCNVCNDDWNFIESCQKYVSSLVGTALKNLIYTLIAFPLFHLKFTLLKLFLLFFKIPCFLHFPFYFLLHLKAKQWLLVTIEITLKSSENYECNYFEKNPKVFCWEISSITYFFGLASYQEYFSFNMNVFM